jgi:hypothetical protein
LKLISFVLGMALSGFVAASMKTAQPESPFGEIPPGFLTILGIAPNTDKWHRSGTLHEAALYGANRLEICSHYYECSAMILIDPKGKFTLGPVRTDYNSDNVQVENIAQDGWKVAADIHSHPCVPHHAPWVFSPEDMIGSIVTRTVAFMVDMCTGNVHEFIPGVTRPDSEKIDEVWLTQGNIIGKVSAFKEEPLAREGI